MSARDVDCEEVERAVELYVDGELVADERGEIERHLAGCAGCARKARVQGAYKAAFRAAAPRPAAPPSLRARILAEVARTPPERAGWHKAFSRAMPALAAASLLCVFAVRHTTRSLVADAAIDSYRDNLPLDVKGPEGAVRDYLSGRVDFPVRPPQLPGAALVGARVQRINARPIPYLVYDVGGSRVNVILFDPQEMPIEAQRRRQVAGREVWLDGSRGYNVALVRDRGLGYAYASDLDEDQMVKLVSSAIGH